MNIQQNKASSLENNGIWVTGPFLDLVESWKYEVKDTGFKVKVDEVLASRKKVSPEQNQINRMIKIAKLKWKQKELIDLLFDSAEDLRWLYMHEFLVEKVSQIPEEDLLDFQTKLSQKITEQQGLEIKEVLKEESELAEKERFARWPSKTGDHFGWSRWPGWPWSWG